MVYDATNPNTFSEMQSYWIKETRQHSAQDRIFCFINKCDNMESTNIDPEQVGYLEKNQVRWFKVSAKKPYNVSEAIIEVAREIMKHEPKLTNAQVNAQLALSESHRRQEQKKCCGK